MNVISYDGVRRITGVWNKEHMCWENGVLPSEQCGVTHHFFTILLLWQENTSTYAEQSYSQFSPVFANSLRTTRPRRADVRRPSRRFFTDNSICLYIMKRLVKTMKFHNIWIYIWLKGKNYRTIFVKKSAESEINPTLLRTINGCWTCLKFTCWPTRKFSFYESEGK